MWQLDRTATTALRDRAGVGRADLSRRSRLAGRAVGRTESRRRHAAEGKTEWRPTNSTRWRASIAVLRGCTARPCHRIRMVRPAGARRRQPGCRSVSADGEQPHQHSEYQPYRDEIQAKTFFGHCR